MSFADLGLDSRYLGAVEAMGYERPTPIQLQAIPHTLEGKDVVGCAQTGTGKTAAFILPVLQRIGRGHRTPRALVVTPTRELAAQIEDVTRECARFTGQRSATVYGGVGYEPQRAKLRRGVDILVATPGRLLDLMSQGDADLSAVEILVLDEADRMLDMGFWPDVKRIIAALPRDRQNLLFSATMSDEVMRVAKDTLSDPVRIQVAPSATPIEAIEQTVYHVDATRKADLLMRLLQDGELDRVLVFTRTKHRADRVARTLDKSRVPSAAIHGNRSQAQRQRALDAFKNGKLRVLVATDIVARGIDVEDISHVINFDLPHVPEDYVHRIGRTARAGSDGSAISFLSPEERGQLKGIEGLIGEVIRRESVDGFGHVHAGAPRPASVAPRSVDVARTTAAGRARTGSGQPRRDGEGQKRRSRRSRRRS